MSLVLFLDDMKGPIYFPNKNPIGVEPRHSLIEKITLALVYSIRQFKPYFKGHAIKVYTKENYLNAYSIMLERRKVTRVMLLIYC